MKPAIATLVFAVTFAIVGLVDASGGVESWVSIAQGLALLFPIAALAFWLGARSALHGWFSSISSGFATFAAVNVAFRFLDHVDTQRWSFLTVEIGILVAVAFFLGRNPLVSPFSLRPRKQR